MRRNEIIGISVALVIFAAAVSFLILKDIVTTAQAIEITILFVLVLVTLIYAKRTAEIADATKEQAEEMREQRIMSSRPVIIQKAVPLLFIDEDAGVSDNFQIYNAGNGPAIELEILLLDKNKKLLIKQRETFLRAGDAIKDFYPTVLGRTC